MKVNKMVSVPKMVDTVVVSADINISEDMTVSLMDLTMFCKGRKNTSASYTSPVHFAGISFLINFVSSGICTIIKITILV